MDHVESGSDARYTDAEGNEFWTKGVIEGVLTLNGQPERNCTGTPAGMIPARYSTCHTTPFAER